LTLSPRSLPFLKFKLSPSCTLNCTALIWRDGEKRRHVSEAKPRRPRLQRGQTSNRRCRCACSHASLAARTPFPPHSAALITPGALEPATAAAPAASVAAMATAGSHATVRLPAPPAPPAGKPPPQLPPSRFSAPMRTARTHARTTCSRLRCGAGCRGDFGRTDRVSCHTDARGGILGCSRGRNRTVSMVPHTYAAGSGFPGAIQQPPAPYMYPACIAQRACSLLAA